MIGFDAQSFAFKRDFPPSPEPTERLDVRNVKVVTDEDANVGIIPNRLKQLFLNHFETGQLYE